MLPCIAAQLIAVWIRFEVYGLTDARWAGILYTVSVLCFIAAVLLKKNAPRVWLLCAVFLCAVSTLTPLSLTRVPSLEQKARLEKLLHEYGYYASGRFAKPEASAIARIPQEQRRAMVSAYNELLSEHKAAYGGTDALSDNSDPQTVFGFPQSNDSPDNEVHKSYKWRKYALDISSYSFMVPTAQSVRKSKDGTVYTEVPLWVERTKYDIFDDLLAAPENGEDFSIELDSETLLFITSANYLYDEERKGLISYQFEGFILIKQQSFVN